MGNTGGAGEFGQDKIRNVTGFAGEILYGDKSTGPFYSDVSLPSRNMIIDGGQTTSGFLNFDLSRSTLTGPENVPPHVWNPVAVYLGSHA